MTESRHAAPASHRNGPEGVNEESEEKKAKNGEEKAKSAPRKTPAYKRPTVIITVSLVVLLAIVGGLIYWLHARHFESTDDAYIDANITQISPQVSARVITLHVDDNQLVHRGDLLVELDSTDYQLALEQAQAQLASSEGKLAQVRTQLDASKAMVGQAQAEADAAQVSVDNTTRDLERYQSVDERARTRQQLDNAVAAQKNAEAQLAQARARQASAEANVAASEASIRAAAGDVRVTTASMHRAETNLSYCHIRAPVDGRVTQRTVDVGNYVQPGQALFMLVSPDVWVTANFKETQLKLMSPGQPVTVKVDAFSGREFQGHVDSIQAGSGSRFSVLPAENATGNFVKTVQRVPVKIVFDYGSNTNNAGLLSPGLSVIPKVRVR